MKEALIEFRAKTVCWANIVGIVALSGFWWWAFDSVVINGLLSVICLCEAYNAFRHRNKCITLTEEGIGLDKVSIIDGRKDKVEKCRHIDIEWRYVRRVELHEYARIDAMEVYAHNKIYIVDTRYYAFLGIQSKLKRWQKAIKDYGHVPCVMKRL